MYTIDLVSYYKFEPVHPWNRIVPYSTIYIRRRQANFNRYL